MPFALLSVAEKLCAPTANVSVVKLQCPVESTVVVPTHDPSTTLIVVPATPMPVRVSKVAVV